MAFHRPPVLFQRVLGARWVGAGPSRRPGANDRQHLTAATTCIWCCTPPQMLTGSQETRARSAQTESTSVIGRQFVQGSRTMKNGRIHPTRCFHAKRRDGMVTSNWVPLEHNRILYNFWTKTLPRQQCNLASLSQRSSCCVLTRGSKRWAPSSTARDFFVRTHIRGFNFAMFSNFLGPSCCLCRPRGAWQSRGSLDFFSWH